MCPSTRSRYRAFFLAVVSLCGIVTLLAQDEFPASERIVAIGDVHGDFDRFAGLLRDAGVIDSKQHWVAGRTQLAQTGDLLDRGPESRKVMDLLMALEKQALKAGGRVHVLLGNHEAMNMYGDLRFVSDGEFAAFRSPYSKELRDAYFENYVTTAIEKENPARKEELRREWYASHPLGWVEHRSAFGPSGTYGKWLRQKNAIIKIGDTLFLHGGISPKYATWPIRELNDRIRKELADFRLLANGVVTDPTGPLWYRGLAEAPEADTTEMVRDLLRHYQVKHVVIGHTATRGAVLPRYGGKVVLVDVGLSQFYGGPPACLIIDRSRFQALHRGTRLDLPFGGPDDLLAYLKAAASLDPRPSPLESLISGTGTPVLSGER